MKKVCFEFTTESNALAQHPRFQCGLTDPGDRVMLETPLAVSLHIRGDGFIVDPTAETLAAIAAESA